MADWWDIDELGELPGSASRFDSFDDMPLSGPSRVLNPQPVHCPPPQQKTVNFANTNAYFDELDKYYQGATKPAPHPISSQYVPRQPAVPKDQSPSLLEIVRSRPAPRPDPEPPQCVQRHYEICLRTMELRQGTLDLHSNLAEPIVVKYKHTCQTRLVTVGFWLRHKAAGTMILAPDSSLERTPWGFFQMIPLD